MYYVKFKNIKAWSLVTGGNKIAKLKENVLFQNLFT
jgi:hypothetical protein